MANKKAKKTTKSSASAKSDSNVVRIKATSAPAPKKEKVVAEAEVTNPPAGGRAAKSEKADKPAKVANSPAGERKAPKERKARKGMRGFSAFGGYFKGAWVELRQVRWPNRRATWSLTAAVLIYTAFFVALILLLDAGFQYLFDLILGN